MCIAPPGGRGPYPTPVPRPRSLRLATGLPITGRICCIPIDPPLVDNLRLHPLRPDGEGEGVSGGLNDVGTGSREASSCSRRRLDLQEPGQHLPPGLQEEVCRISSAGGRRRLVPGGLQSRAPFPRRDTGKDQPQRHGRCHRNLRRAQFGGIQLQEIAYTRFPGGQRGSPRPRSRGTSSGRSRQPVVVGRDPDGEGGITVGERQPQRAALVHHAPRKGRGRSGAPRGPVRPPPGAPPGSGYTGPGAQGGVQGHELRGDGSIRVLAPPPDPPPPPPGQREGSTASAIPSPSPPSDDRGDCPRPSGGSTDERGLPDPRRSPGANQQSKQPPAKRNPSRAEAGRRPSTDPSGPAGGRGPPWRFGGGCHPRAGHRVTSADSTRDRRLPGTTQLYRGYAGGASPPRNHEVQTHRHWAPTGPEASVVRTFSPEVPTREAVPPRHGDQVWARTAGGSPGTRASSRPPGWPPGGLRKNSASSRAWMGRRGSGAANPGR